MTFNGCYYNTRGIEWYANDRIRSVNSPPPSPRRRAVTTSVSRAALRGWNSSSLPSVPSGIAATAA